MFKFHPPGDVAGNNSVKIQIHNLGARDDGGGGLGSTNMSIHGAGSNATNTLGIKGH